MVVPINSTHHQYYLIKAAVFEIHWVLSILSVAMVDAMVKEPRQSQTFWPQRVIIVPGSTLLLHRSTAEASTIATEVKYEQHTTFDPHET